MVAVAFIALHVALVAIRDNVSLALAVGNDFKGKVSLTLYGLAVPIAFVNRWVSDALIVLVALIWFIPDRRIEKRAAG